MRNPRVHDTRTCSNCGGLLATVLIGEGSSEEMLVCDGCGWEEGDEDPR